jgi:hypothetical protein
MLSKRSSRRASEGWGRFVQGDLRVAHSTLKCSRECVFRHEPLWPNRFARQKPAAKFVTNQLMLWIVESVVRRGAPF